MLSAESLGAAIDGADISKIEFEVLESGKIRWLLWGGAKRLYSATLDRPELIEALQSSGVLLRVMMLVNQEEFQGTN